MTTLLPRIGPPYTGRHRADTIARTVGADVDADTAARNARRRLTERINTMRREAAR